MAEPAEGYDSCNTFKNVKDYHNEMRKEELPMPHMTTTEKLMGPGPDDENED